MKKKIFFYYKKAFRFVTRDVWNADAHKYNRPSAFLIRQLRIFLITLRGAKEDKVALHSAALTFYTLMALVPIVAMIFALAKGFGISEQLQQVLWNAFPEQDEMIEQLTVFAENAINNTKSGWLGSLGIVFLLWSVIKVMNRIEMSFNNVWQVKRARSWARKFTDYLAVLIVTPFFFVVSSSISLSIRYKVGGWFEGVPLLEHASHLFGTLMPFVLVYIMLTVLYVVIPNTKVKVLPALWGAIFAGTLFQLTQNLYIYTQLSVSKYSAIYGAFAALPLLFLLVNISWQLVLLGAELSFAYQNAERYRYEMTAERISTYQRKLAALVIMQEIARNFVNNKTPYTNSELSERLDLPYRLVSNTINELQQCRFVTEVVLDKKERDSAYHPAFDVHKLTVGMVVHSIDDLGQSPMSKSATEDMAAFSRILSEQAAIFDASPENKLLIDV
ncbi:MAG: YihY/virulence factor BrkB family protein [Bacteroidales bacterium]|nr:YihY/virulence factor BrkB family protein [Bacteroidales bacterium]MCL2133095.1 YihY/virulence factor BrkB family protein [Bacteroidales bacterium]